MGRLLTFYRYTVGKKFVMAVTGVILFLFIVGHLFGNLKIFMGPEVFNHYAQGLRSLGSPLFADEQALWIARTGLIVALILHLVAMAQLTALSKSARPAGYEKKKLISFSAASHTMFWGGLTLFAFILFHLAHLTFGRVFPQEFSEVVGQNGKLFPDAYNNVIFGFQHPVVSILYLLALVCLGLHLYHGLWSGCQTLGLNHPRYNHLRRPIAGAVAVLIVVGYAAIPIAVMAGLIHPSGTI